jgi:hypothetical protein
MCITNRMSKITFRADDELITQLEEFDASKSEVMREALREYLDETPSADSAVTDAVDETSLDDLIVERVDAIIEERLDEPASPRQRDVNVNISLDRDSPNTSDVRREGASVTSDPSADVSNVSEPRMTDEGDRESQDENESKTCEQCGTALSSSHVYCPNCGEKASHRVFCECGDEIRSDWGFCPSCGRRTPAADVLDQT